MKIITILLTLSLAALSFAEQVPPKDYLRPEINNKILTGEEAIKHMHIADGYQVQLFAAEPHVINPVVMRFDELGRLWVVEMIGYMNNIQGTKELDKIGRISYYTDSNRDGKMDKAHVFLDELIEPRAMTFHKNGLLWADTENLYFTPILKQTTAGNTILIDEGYAKGHSVEHKPNALLRNIDNWYYSAKSNKRYREIDGKWVIEKTEYRGQFGLGMDNHGRLYHGQQNTLLRADVFSPNFFKRHNNINVRIGGLSTKFHETLDYCYNVKVGEEAVYPVRMSRDIRDGYAESKSRDIDEQGYAFRCTSACSHFIYRDDYFPKEHTAFIADPALHLVKVFTLDRKNGIPSGKNTFKQEEIIASPDTRFRPVDVQSAPDGSIYIADMYHGILQHKAFMNQHLAKFIRKNKLEGNGIYGRIYRLSVKNKVSNPWMPLDKPSLKELVFALDSKSPWRRDHAQRLLVDGANKEALPLLEKFLSENKTALGKIHALWTLEGYQAIKEKHILKALESKNEDLVIHAIRLSWQLKNTNTLLKSILKSLPENFNESSYYVLQRLAHFKQQEAHKVIASHYQKNKKQPYLLKAILSGGGADSVQWIAYLPEGNHKNHISNQLIHFTNIKKQMQSKLTGKDLKQYNNGKTIYFQSCFSCHGMKGEGLTDMGPPLKQSEWVNESPERLTKILLKGMQGELKVNGIHYKPKASMPAFEAMMNDKQLADVMTFIRNTWGNESSVVSPGHVKRFRENNKSLVGPLEAKDLP